MTEKRFLSNIMVEGIVLIVLSLCLLILPRLTELSYGVMLSCVFMTYGLYRIIISIINKTYGLGIIYGIIMGLYLGTIGVLLLFVPRVNLLWLIELTGVYFIFESFSSAIFSYYLQNRYSYWGSKVISSIILFTVGLLIILGVPLMSFWFVTVLSGVAMLIKGGSKFILASVNLNNYNI